MIARAGLGLIALLAASPGSAAVAALGDSGFVVRQVAETTASSEDAWRALVAPAQWWDSAHTYSGDAANLTIDPRAGGCFCEVLPAPADAERGAAAGSVEHMRVIHADPGRFLRLSGGLGPLQSEAVVGTLTMTLKAQDGGTRILWEYVVGGQMRYKTEQIAAAVDQVLAQQIGRLAKKLGLPEGAGEGPAKPEAGPGDEAVSAPDADPAPDADDALPPGRSKAPALEEGR